ncbi:hypothetical protein KQX54_005465 [Cotesia glomerata]|uniref:Uncharacterized protein n=1 Tax=Cotesia glomerata TaxID=32391 RepID=A0AAV7HCY0_COTGL|nr:hypothetical protein KQX54_005465 [Cotesia glomerata]
MGDYNWYQNQDYYYYQQQNSYYQQQEHQYNQNGYPYHQDYLYRLSLQIKESNSSGRTQKSNYCIVAGDDLSFETFEGGVKKV